ncbi:MAG: SDR family oxidoreductase, partial [Methylococcales bacterium]|nr:SDR family oxidoreductase [Methylococcales bacterium]
GRVKTLQVDLLDDRASSDLIDLANRSLGGLDMVINLAGIQTFQPLDNLSEKAISRQISINLTLPIQISRTAAKIFTAQRSGTIVNIGSTFGAIAFAHYTVYSASKFGLRGFSEAFGRELKGSGVNVVYVAPRATRTAMNSDAVYQMAKATRTAVDEPSDVAQQIIRAIEKQRPTTHLGFPEKLFCKINALFPSLIDRALASQNRLAQQHTEQNNHYD